MEVEIKIVKELPVKQIDSFMDKSIYNMVAITREYTKSLNAYPYLTGELSRQEIALPIEGNNKEYSLGTGVEYAKRVYNYENANWTNKRTEPHWYFGIYNKYKNSITTEAVNRAIKEV